MKIKGIAHRGYPVKYPENTLSSFQAACDLSYTYVELDVQLSKDGIPVVIHDYTIDRMSDAKGFIRDFTLQELKQVRIGDNETIPTLEETLLLLRGKLNVMVELKQAGDLYQGLEEKVLEVIHRTDTFDQVILISFDHFSIVRMRQLSPAIRLGLTSSCAMPYVIPFMKEYNCELLGVPIRMMTRKYVDMLMEHGIIVGPWQVDTITDMEWIAEEYPHSLITTNQLELWAEFYRNHPKLHV